jgi:hypothetical protein
VFWCNENCIPESRCRRMEIGMMVKRIIAGSIVTLLLSVSSLAAACDLSCAFGGANSDCHSQETPFQDSANAGMKMDGMDMAGMTMLDISKGESQQPDSAISSPTPGHPLIGEMGVCEKQPCYDGPAIASKTARFVDSQIHSFVAIIEAPGTEVSLPFSYDARDDIASYRPLDLNPLQLTLRI